MESTEVEDGTEPTIVLCRQVAVGIKSALKSPPQSG